MCVCNLGFPLFKSNLLENHQVWMIISGAESLRNLHPKQYEDMLCIKVNPHSSTVEQINTDLNRTFPSNIYFKKDEPGCMQQQLFNVLLAYANKNPHIGYCQVEADGEAPMKQKEFYFCKILFHHVCRA